MRDESNVWFRDTRGNFIRPDKVLAWAEVPPFDIERDDAKYSGELEQLVKELEEENMRLSSCLSDDAENERLRDENAKLRKLCADMFEAVKCCCGEWCTKTVSNCDNNECGWRKCYVALRELGIELDNG